MAVIRLHTHTDHEVQESRCVHACQQPTSLSLLSFLLSISSMLAGACCLVAFLASFASAFSLTALSSILLCAALL